MRQTMCEKILTIRTFQKSPYHPENFTWYGGGKRKTPYTMGFSGIFSRLPFFVVVQGWYGKKTLYHGALRGCRTTVPPKVGSQTFRDVRIGTVSVNVASVIVCGLFAQKNISKNAFWVVRWYGSAKKPYTTGAKCRTRKKLVGGTGWYTIISLFRKSLISWAFQGLQKMLSRTTTKYGNCRKRER